MVEALGFPDHSVVATLEHTSGIWLQVSVHESTAGGSPSASTGASLEAPGG